MQHIIAETELGGDRLRTTPLITFEHFLQQQRGTLTVQYQGIQAQMKTPLLSVKPGQTNIKQGPGGGVQHLVGQFLGGGLRPRAGLVCGQPPTVLHRDIPIRHLGQDLLQALRGDHRAQGRMAGDDGAPGGHKPRGIQILEGVFAVGVTGQLAQRHQALSAQPIGLLNRGQGEWPVGLCRIRGQRAWLRARLCRPGCGRQCPGDLLQARCRKQRLHRQAFTTGLAQGGQQSGGGQGVAAQAEEVVRQGHPFQPQ